MFCLVATETIFVVTEILLLLVVNSKSYAVIRFSVVYDRNSSLCKLDSQNLVATSKHLS